MMQSSLCAVETTAKRSTFVGWIIIYFALGLLVLHSKGLDISMKMHNDARCVLVSFFAKGLELVRGKVSYFRFYTNTTSHYRLTVKQRPLAYSWSLHLMLVVIITL